MSSDELQRYSNRFHHFTAEIEAQCKIFATIQNAKSKLNNEIILIVQKADQEALINMEKFLMDVETDIK
jgi:hypothetical protein